MKIVSDVKSNLSPGKIIAVVIGVLITGVLIWAVRKTAIGNKVVSAIPGNQTTGV